MIFQSISRIAHLIFIGVALLTMTASTVAAPPEVQTQSNSAQPITQAYKAALLRMLTAMHYEESMQLGVAQILMQRGENKTTSEAAAKEMVGTSKNNQIIEIIAPIYAQYLAIETVQQVTQFYESPLGQKMMAAVLNEIRAGQKVTLESAHLSDTEKRTIMEFGRSPAGVAITQAQARVHSDFLQKNPENADKKRHEAFAFIYFEAHGIVQEANAKNSGKSASTENTPVSVNSPVSDVEHDIGIRLIMLSMQSAKRMGEIRKAFQEDSQKVLGNTPLLQAQQMTAADSLTEEKQKMKRLGDLAEKFLSESDNMRETLRKDISMHATSFPVMYQEAFNQHGEKGLTRSAEECKQFVEHQRRLLALDAQVIDLAESNIGQTEVLDNALIFSKPDAQEAYRALLAQIAQENEHVVRIHGSIYEYLSAN